MSNQTNFQPDAETQKLFQEALQKNKKEREEKEERRKGGFTGNFEQVEWCGLESGKDVVGRLIGSPVELRKKETDPNFVYFSKILNDNGTGYSEIKWKTKADGTIDEDWILYELYSTIMKKEWVKYADGHTNDKGYDGEYRFINEGKPSYDRLFKNRKKDASPKFIPPKVAPKKRLLINWLDRMDNWCKENKHYKLLTSKKSYWKDDTNGKPIYMSDFGVPEMVYTRIMDNVVAYRDSWDLDIIITKNYNPNDLANAYIVKDIFEDKISKEAKALGKTDALTEEEKSYEAYNIDNLSKASTYQKLIKNLIGLFTYADADTGMKHHFVDRLKELAEKEAKEEAEKKKEQVDNTEIEQDTVDPDSVEEASGKELVDKLKDLTNTKVETKTRHASVPESTSIESLCKTNFPKWDSLPKDEKDTFIATIEKFEGKVPMYKEGTVALPCVDKNCKFLESSSQTVFPDTIFTCPICGQKDNSGN